MFRVNPQRLAWITMLTALVIFFALCAGTVLLIRWVVFESPTSLNTTLYVGQGTVGLWEPDQSSEKAVRGSDTVGPDNRLSTDNLSQGYIAFTDPYSGDLVATVLLRNGSTATFNTASRPRFSLSDNPYIIRLTKVTGRVEIWVRAGLDREARIEIVAPLGTAHINEGGNFWIDSRSDALQVTARSGSLTLSYGDQALHLAQGTEAQVNQGDAAIVTEPGPIDLLPNWDFAQVSPGLVAGDGSGTASDWPVEWNCSWDPSAQYQDAPAGTWKFTTVGGRPVIHIVRMMQPDPGPGKTGCLKYPGGHDGLDVTQYATLRLRVTMQVHYQSLSACGSVGSECPVMLFMSYEDKDGNEYGWYHGFYAEYRPNEGRTTCDSCLQPHEQINKDAWYSYESGDLFSDLPSDRRPAKISFLRFYADGHQYDVMLNEVALVATLADPATP